MLQRNQTYDSKGGEEKAARPGAVAPEETQGVSPLGWLFASYPRRGAEDAGNPEAAAEANKKGCNKLLFSLTKGPATWQPNKTI